MRIVVSGTHASGKSTLVSDLVMTLPGYASLGDPFDLVDVDDPACAASFLAQFEVSVERLAELPRGACTVLERGPLDFLAYLEALGALGRSTVAPAALDRLRATAAQALEGVDVLVVLALDEGHGIWVPEHEDPELREAMDRHLLDLCADDDLVAGVGQVIEVAGSPQDRAQVVLTAMGSTAR
ncbi:hypothetical protein GCM10023153_02950 [Ornithinibacter aureus]|uniref:NadR/Ttd14 AAA domain-containing protein n=1 Tax=Ornithinibacter aureus TaxID=622664 RepID=A0ABP8JB53_9MICO|nr:AAA family ATPase [Ornithinibacter aureus]KAF0832742.1 AAA domain-containing protein [Ornithinibacter aureus]